MQLYLTHTYSRKSIFRSVSQSYNVISHAEFPRMHMKPYISNDSLLTPCRVDDDAVLSGGVIFRGYACVCVLFRIHVLTSTCWRGDKSDGLCVMLQITLLRRTNVSTDEYCNAIRVFGSEQDRHKYVLKFSSWYSAWFRPCKTYVKMPAVR